MNLSVSYIYGEALELTKKYGFRVLGLMLLLSVVLLGSMFLALPSGFFTDALVKVAGNPERIFELYGKMLPAIAVAAVVGQFLYVGYYGYVIAIAREQEISFFGGFNRSALTYVKFFVVQLLSSLVMILGCVLFLLPGVYLGVRLCWAGFHVLEAPECGIFEAFQWSWQKTDGQFLTLFGLFMVSFGLNIGMSLLFQLLGIGVGMAGTVAVAIFAVIQMVCTLFLAVYINIAQIKTFVTLADGTDNSEYKY